MKVGHTPPVTDGTTELVVNHGRPFVEIEFPATGRRAVAWLDTGGGAFIVGNRLGDDIDVHPVTRQVDGEDREVIDLPEVRVDGSPLKVADSYAVKFGEDLIAEGFRAEAFIPAHVMARHAIVFDYVGRTFAVDPASDPVGTRVPALSYPRPGWPAVTVTIAGEVVNLLLDTGVSCCMLSERLVERLASKIIGRTSGAFGLANMSGGPWEVERDTVRLPDMEWGDLRLPSVVAVTRREGAFEEMMSSGMPIPVEGAIAGNVLRNMRVDWRAANQSAWIDAEAVVEEALCQVPLILHATDGLLRVVGVDPRAESMGVLAGDELVGVDGVPVVDKTFGEAVELLGGTPGERRQLELRRDTELQQVDAEVIHIL